MLMMKPRPAVTEAAPLDPLDELRAYLAALPIGARYQMASRTLAAARDARVAIVEKQQPERRELTMLWSAEGRLYPRRLRALEQELAGADAAIEAAKRDLQAAQLAAAPKLKAALADRRRVAARQVLDALDLLAEAGAALFEMDKHMARRGLLDVPTLNVPSLQHLVEPARRLAEGV